MLRNQTSTEIRNRERRLRAALDRHGYALRKTPTRHWTRKHYGPGYMVLADNVVALGAYRREYDATLEQCERFLETLA